MERVSAQRCCIPYIVIEIFDCNCNDLELGRFKAIQGQRSWCQSIAHMWFPIRLPLTPSSFIFHGFRNIGRVILMTLNFNSFRVKDLLTH